MPVRCDVPAQTLLRQVADETKSEFAKGVAEAMKRKLDRKAGLLEWELRLEEAALAAAAGGKEVSQEVS